MIERASLFKIIVVFTILSIVVVGAGTLNIWLGVIAMLIAVPLFDSLIH